MREKDLEDYLCDHLPLFFWEHTELIGRQVRVQHGIIDILAWSGPNMCWNNIPLIIELKITPLKEKDIGQLLRYMGDIRTILQSISIYPEEGSPLTKIVERRIYNQDYRQPAVKGFLIGPKADGKICSAAFGADIAVGEWALNDDGLSITPARNPPLTTYSSNLTEELEKRVRGACIEDLFCNRVDNAIDYKGPIAHE